jgi:Ethanolamine utilization protein EutJ (predicted chaperonin)
MVQIIQKIRHELAQKYRRSGAGHTYQDASYEIVTDPKVIVIFQMGYRHNDSLLPGNLSQHAKIPIQVLHNIGVKVINIIFPPHNASKVVFYDMKSNQLYDIEGFHFQPVHTVY